MKSNKNRVEISSVTSLCDRRLTAPCITAQLNKYCEKICQHPLWEDSEKLVYMAWLLSRNHCWGSKTMSKGSSGPRCTITGQYSSRTKSFELKNQNFKSLGQIGGSVCSKELMKDAATSWITPTVKHGGESAMVRGVCPNCKVGHLHQVKGKLNQTDYLSILQHHAMHLEHSL